jgi:hypothetical protein
MNKYFSLTSFIDSKHSFNTSDVHFLLTFNYYTADYLSKVFPKTNYFICKGNRRHVSLSFKIFVDKYKEMSK